MRRVCRFFFATRDGVGVGDDGVSPVGRVRCQTTVFLVFRRFFFTTPFPEYFFFTVFLSMGINVQSGGLAKLTKKESTSSDDDDDDSSELQGKTATAAGVEVRYRVLLFFFRQPFSLPL